jgi:hypothetical protein
MDHLYDNRNREFAVSATALGHDELLASGLPEATIGPDGNGGSAALGFGADPGSSFANAAFNGASRGEYGNLSSAMLRRTSAVTAASSSSVRSIVGTQSILCSRRHER